MNPSNRTQLLRRYEAEASVCATDPESPGMDFYSPFGPMIAKVKIAIPLIDRINQYADEFIAGRQGMEFVLPQSLVFDGGEESLANQTGGSSCVISSGSRARPWLKSSSRASGW